MCVCVCVCVGVCLAWQREVCANTNRVVLAESTLMSFPDIPLGTHGEAVLFEEREDLDVWNV